MTRKDISTLRRRFAASEAAPVTKLSVSYVDVHNDGFHLGGAEDFARLPEDDQMGYTRIFKKAVSGKPDVTVFDVAPGDGIMERLRSDRLATEDAIQDFCLKVAGNAGYDDNYAVALAYGRMENPDYDFVMACVIPCPVLKKCLFYDTVKHEAKASPLQRVMSEAEHTLLFPAFIDGLPDAGKVMCFSKTARAAQKGKALIEGVLDAKLLPAAGEQRSAFQVMLSAGYGMEKVPYGAASGVMDALGELVTASELSGEGARISAKELADIIIKHHGPGSIDSEAVRSAAEEYSGTSFLPGNLLGKTISVETDLADIRLSRQDLCRMRKQTVNGEECYVIPVRDVYIEDIPVE